MQAHRILNTRRLQSQVMRAAQEVDLYLVLFITSSGGV
jgi:hypothetical protein